MIRLCVPVGGMPGVPGFPGILFSYALFMGILSGGVGGIFSFGFGFLLLA